MANARSSKGPASAVASSRTTCPPTCVRWSLGWRVHATQLLVLVEFGVSVWRVVLPPGWCSLGSWDGGNRRLPRCIAGWHIGHGDRHHRKHAVCAVSYTHLTLPT